MPSAVSPMYRMLGGKLHALLGISLPLPLPFCQWLAIRGAQGRGWVNQEEDETSYSVDNTE